MHAAHDELAVASGKGRAQRERVTRLLTTVEANNDLAEHRT
jgi:hypothetical protein